MLATPFGGFNMIADIVYQISVFGDFLSITPNGKTITEMMANFKDYDLLPTLFQENSFNLPPDTGLAKMETKSRLSMVSIDKKLNVMFASGRLDISKSSADLTSPLSSEDTEVLLDILGKATLGRSFTRIALNTTAILNNPSDSVMGKIQPNLDFYADPNELTLRLNKRVELLISDSSNEISNAIITFQKTMGQLLLNNQPMSIDNGLIVQFDINTLAENSSARFSPEQAKMFIKSAESLRQQILGQLLS